MGGEQVADTKNAHDQTNGEDEASKDLDETGIRLCQTSRSRLDDL